MPRVLVSTDSGFTAYPLVDPTIVADTDGNGFIPSYAALQANDVDPSVSLHSYLTLTEKPQQADGPSLEAGHLGLARSEVKTPSVVRLGVATAADMAALDEYFAQVGKDGEESFGTSGAASLRPRRLYQLLGRRPIN